MDVLERHNQAEVICIESILEFLVNYKFHNTLRAFQNDLKQHNYPLSDNLPAVCDRIDKVHVPALMKLFEVGEYEDFFEKWNSVIPDGIKCLTEYKKLTIHLYIYFIMMENRHEERNQNNLSKTMNTSNSTDSVFINNETKTSKKVEITNRTFIIEKPSYNNRLPIVSEAEQLSANDAVSKNDDEDSSFREFEADSLDNDTENDEDCYEESDEHHLKIMKKSEQCPPMVMFKKYLVKNGSEFTETPEFLPFFALPFVDNPRLHPTFAKLFQENRMTDLKQAVLEFLINYSCGDVVNPRLMKFYLNNTETKFSKDNVEEISQTSHVDDSLKKLKEVKKKLHRLKKDHQKLVGVASELSSALEKSVKGEAVNLKSTLSNCVEIFPDLFSTDATSNPLNKWQLGKFDDKNNIQEENKLNWKQIDIKKIKHDLLHASVKNKLLLLQALRWLITRRPAEHRELIVTQFCRQDMLGLNSSFISDSLAPQSAPHPLQQSVARLLNALSTFSTGRDYICSSKITVQLLLDITKLNDLDSVTEDMIIATLQKLSLRRRLAELMAHNNILEWLLAKLETGPLKKYTLEYTTSLVMNLSTITPQLFWESHDKSVLYLIELLKTSHKQVIEFVCGTLYCIIKSDVANKYCENYGLIRHLTECLDSNKNDATLVKQISTLMQLHKRDLSPNDLQMNASFCSDDDQEDPDELESEIDENDLVKGNPSGDTLLSEHYSLVFTAPSIVERHVNKSPKHEYRSSTPQLSNIPAWAQV